MRRFVIQFGLFNEKKEKSEERIKHVRNDVVRAECCGTLEGIVDHGDARLQHWAVRVAWTGVAWHLTAGH